MPKSSISRSVSPTRTDQHCASARWVAITLLIALLAALPLHAVPKDMALLLEVQLNGYPTGKIAEFTLRGGALLSKPEELRDLGLRLPANARDVAVDGLIPVAALPGVTWHLEQTTQMIYITASVSSLNATVVKTGRESGNDLKVETGKGALLNYDIVDTLVGMQNGVSGSFDAKAFSPWGVISSGTLAYLGRGGPVGRTNRLVRLDTSYTFADTDSLHRYTVGDFITGGLSWTRPVRLEGFQVRSDFSMRPDLVTFPLPTVSGATAVPSTVSVLANGDYVLSHEVDPGPFEIPQLPVVSGAGNISMTVTDSLGHPTTVNQPFYASTSLLKPGLQAFSAQAGFVRLNWGTESNDDGSLAGSATYRRGLTDKVTVEGSAEATSQVAMGGGAVLMNVHNQGVVNAGLATSTSTAGDGAQYTAGLQRMGRSVSLSATWTAASQNFRDVAAISGQPVPRRQISGNVGFTARREGSLGVAFVALDEQENITAKEGSSLVAEHPRVLSASYSVQMHDVSVSASLFRDFSSSGSTGVTMGVTIPFGKTGSMTASVGNDSSLAQLQVRKSAVAVGDWGYQAFISGGGSPHEFAEVEHKARTSLFSIGLDRTDGSTSLISETQGAFSYADGSVFSSNTINDSFAVVDSGGLPDIHVLEENRTIGVTDRKGRLLVPDLRSFDSNLIEINPTDVPMDTAVTSIVKHVRPMDHSGVVVRFDIHASQSVLLRMVDETGNPIPVGSTATVRKTGVAAPVGFDGEAFLQDLEASNQIDVVIAGGHKCSFSLAYKAIPGFIPTVGPKTCNTQH